MKYFLTLFILFAGLGLNAANTMEGVDNRINDTALSAGSIIDAPKGYIQVTEPWINMGSMNTKSLFADEASAAAACQIIGKSLVGFQSFNNFKSVPQQVAQFYKSGTMSLVSATNKIGILTCKENSN